MATADVSFISLKKIFPAVDRILEPDGVCLCLVKPQFEAHPKELGKNGILRDPAVLPPLLESLAASAAENNLMLDGLTVSPIHGTNGNVEYLACLRRRSAHTREEWPAMIAAAAALRPDD